MKKVLILGLLLLVVVSVSLTTLAQELMKVKGIEISGNKGVATSEIMKAVTFKHEQVITEEDLKKSAQNILDLGYFQRVEPDYRIVEGGIKVTFAVVENPKIEKIEIVGNKEYKQVLKILGLKIPLQWRILKTEKAIEILKNKGIEVGKVLNVKHLQEGLQAIMQEYQKKGYALIRIGEVKLEPPLFIEIVEARVERVEIKGLKDVPEEIARSLIKIPPSLEPTKLGPLQASFKRINNSIYFKESKLEDIDFQAGSTKENIVLVWTLKERQLINQSQDIKQIKFVGNTVYNGEQLMKLIKLPRGPINNFQLLSTLNGVYNLYHKEGYAFMDLVAEEVKDGILTLRIHEGVIEEIAIRGNQRTSEYVIKKELKLKPGDILTEPKFRDSYRSLLQLGYFKEEGTQMDVERLSSGKLKIIVQVSEETRLGSLSGGLTYAPEGGIFGQLKLAFKNLNGTGQDVSLNFDRGIFGAASMNWSLNYNTRAFFKDFNFLNIRLFRGITEETVEEGVENPPPNRAGGEVSLGYPLGSSAQLEISYRHEQEAELTNVISLSLTSDDRNNPLFATIGGTKSLRIEKAGGFAVGAEFAKLVFSLTQHLPTLDNQNIAFRILWGLGTQLPKRESFFLGGVNTVRGWKAVEAERFAVLNLEYRIRFEEGISGALFLDGGAGEDLHLKSSVGIELRVPLPYLGPVRLAIVWPILEKFYLAPVFEFGFGSMF